MYVVCCLYYFFFFNFLCIFISLFERILRMCVLFEKKTWFALLSPLLSFNYKFSWVKLWRVCMCVCALFGIFFYLFIYYHSVGVHLHRKVNASAHIILVSFWGFEHYILIMQNDSFQYCGWITVCRRSQVPFPLHQQQQQKQQQQQQNIWSKRGLNAHFAISTHLLKNVVVVWKI